MQMRFNFEQAEALKERGIERASLSRVDLLEKARMAAVNIAIAYGEVTADDVYRALEAQGCDVTFLGNAAGAIFRTGFEFTGRWARSARTSNHARQNRVWRLKSGKPPKIVLPCEFCGYRFNREWLGRYGCPNCNGEGLKERA